MATTTQLRFHKHRRITPSAWQSCSPALLLSPLVLALSLLPGESRAQASATSSASNTAERQGGPVGLGLLVGNLSGLSFKLALDPAQGIQLRLGSSGLNSVALSGSYEYHFRPVVVPDSTYSLPFYAGVGARMQAQAGSSVAFEGGLEGVFGMSILVKDLPVEIFMEVRPRIVLYTPPVTSSDDVWLGAGVEGGMGVHYYF